MDASMFSVSPMLDLPNEVLLLIISLLDIPDIISLRKVRDRRDCTVSLVLQLTRIHITELIRHA